MCKVENVCHHRTPDTHKAFLFLDRPLAVVQTAVLNHLKLRGIYYLLARIATVQALVILFQRFFSYHDPLWLEQT